MDVNRCKLKKSLHIFNRKSFVNFKSTFTITNIQFNTDATNINTKPQY